MRYSTETGGLKTLSIASLVIAITTTVFVGALTVNVMQYRNLGGSSSTASSTASQSIGQPISGQVASQLAGVTIQTLAAVGNGSSGVTSPAVITNASSPLTSDGKPEVLYVGGEFCPFCGAERWALVVAMSKFGNFTGLEYMLSSSTDVYPDTPTFTFAASNYSSPYLSFVPVESQNRSSVLVQPLTPAQGALFSQYDNAASIPFVDFGNKYVLLGAQYSPAILRSGGSATGAPYEWSTVASQLNTPGSTIAQNVDGSANRLIRALCVLTGQQPMSVCSQSFARTMAYAAGTPPVASAPRFADARRHSQA
ncbi:MAG TPA: DUF929 family protein [Nitrososphaerales archaeon]|nr:DUF929 family protein [Nitrososphaerales archaeon]